MGLVDEITSSEVLTLDTNIFIYAYQKGKPKSTISLQLLEKIKAVGARCFISVLVYEEFLVGVYKQGLEKNISTYEDFLTCDGLISVVDIDRKIARTAAKLRARHSSLRTPDAIHLASAIESGARIFITTDRRLKQKFPKLKVEVLS